MDLDEDDYETLGFGNTLAYEALAKLIVIKVLYRQDYLREYYKLNRKVRLAYQKKYHEDNKDYINKRKRDAYAAKTTTTKTNTKPP